MLICNLSPWRSNTLFLEILSVRPSFLAMSKNLPEKMSRICQHNKSHSGSAHIWQPLMRSPLFKMYLAYTPTQRFVLSSILTIQKNNYLISAPTVSHSLSSILSCFSRESCCFCCRNYTVLISSAWGVLQFENCSKF